MKTLLTLFCLSLSLFVFPQKGKKADKSSSKSVSELLKLPVDSTAFLRETAARACSCIDSISVLGKSQKQVSAEIAECIEKEVTAYQLSLKLFRSLGDGNSDKTITINTDKNSNGYKQYYYEIERYLNDSCKSLKTAAASNNEELEFSTSSDPGAVKAYNEGINRMQAEDYKEAANFFEKALKIDEKFAFAWDNLGICCRKMERYEDALKAYKRSLELDPKGKTPLQNIPVVYTYMKNYDAAIKAYEDLAAVYPNDPETFYGIGNIYTYSKPDMEKALHNMCKAYNLYVEQKSPYRTDAENAISYIYGQMKKTGKEDKFYEILKEYHLSPAK